MRKLALAAVAAACLLPTQAFAADTVANLTSDKLAKILSAATGKEGKITKPEAGVEVVTIRETDGADYDYVLSECTAQGCPDLQMNMFFNKDDSFNLGLVNSYNGKALNASAFLSPENRVYLVRHVVLQGGVTEENIKANIKIFLAAPDLFIEHVASQQTASAAPGVTPVAAPTSPFAGTPADAGAAAAAAPAPKGLFKHAATRQGRGVK
jgi:hypothetical protein